MHRAYQSLHSDKRKLHTLYFVICLLERRQKIFLKMKKYFLISLCALCFSFFANAEERILVLENPNNTLAEKAWDAALLDLQMQNRDLLIASFISENKDRFSAIDMQRINVSLGELSDTQLTLIANNSYKDPTTSLILSILVGGLGVDRFYIGDVGLGVVKLVTAGGLGIWWLVDLFVIQNRTKKVNMKEFEEDLSTTNLYLPKE